MEPEINEQFSVAVKEFAKKEQIFNALDLDLILNFCKEARLHSDEGTEYQEQVSSGLKELLTGEPYNDHDGKTISQLSPVDRDAKMLALDKLECAYHLLTSIKALVSSAGQDISGDRGESKAPVLGDDEIKGMILGCEAMLSHLAASQTALRVLMKASAIRAVENSMPEVFEDGAGGGAIH